MHNSLLTEWRPIYRLPLIRLIAAFNRLKIYQAVLTAAGAPILFGLQQAGHITSDVFGIYATLGISGVVTLTLGSMAASNLIGFIYINDQEDMLKLAYVDFWGRRQEQLVEIDQIKPAWEQRISFYQRIELIDDDKQRYKLLQRFGVVSDPAIFESLFGH
ncbi:CG4627 [Drosophila busckii]|uniref:Transmembrane protein 186 n=2 Tax=Drosophila busckii TaxID=30019 RepID=A0A0M5J085_DROBS|nr:CG4627 [Drosophila busckii]